MTESVSLRYGNSFFAVPFPSADIIKEGDYVSGLEVEGHESSGIVSKVDREGVEYSIVDTSLETCSRFYCKYNELPDNARFDRPVSLMGVTRPVLVAAGPACLRGIEKFLELEQSK